jgi:signal transduction histidine kinase
MTSKSDPVTQQGYERFDRTSRVILVAALLALMLSVLLAGYRHSLPTDGRELLDEPEFGLYFGEDTDLLAVDGVPVDDIVAGAIMLRPRRPANWAVGERITYIFKDGTSKAFYLQPSVLSNDIEGLWSWMGLFILVVQVAFGTFVFLHRPQDHATRLLFVFGFLSLLGIITNLVTDDVSGIRLTDFFYVGAYWPTLLSQVSEGLTLPIFFHFLLIFPQVKKPMRHYPRRLPVLLYGSTLFNVGPGLGEPMGLLFGELAGVLALIWLLVMLLGIVISAGHTLLTLRDPAKGVRMPWLAGAIAMPFFYFLIFFLALLTAILTALLGWKVWGNPSLENVLNLFLSGVGTVSFLGFPLLFTVAIWRYRLFGIDLLINRTLVYGALTAIVVGLYVVVVGSLGALFQTEDDLVFSVLVTGLIAVLFQPLRERLQRAANRLMYGERDDPVAVLSRLGQQLEATLATESVLPKIVETVAQALRLPYVAIALKQSHTFTIVATHGDPTDDVSSLPLVYQGETIGRLTVAPRSPGEGFTPPDWRLLENIAQQTGAAAHAVQLTADLQRSRERLIAAREEERRRLRRDLHDGLGPQLASLALKIDAARNLLSHDSARVDALLLELKSQIQAAIADIRRVVYDLRPPALDQLGLVPALRERALARNTLNGLEISIEAPASLPPLPAAVEVAAYRIVLEALTNVERHARARRCVVRLTLDSALQLEIVDDGVGLTGDYQAGVGLTSMRERAVELGGTCVVEAAVGRGTRVLVRLPFSCHS